MELEDCEEMPERLRTSLECRRESNQYYEKMSIYCSSEKDCLYKALCKESDKKRCMRL